MMQGLPSVDRVSRIFEFLIEYLKTGQLPEIKNDR
jgi:hypothetical protein